MRPRRDVQREAAHGALGGEALHHHRAALHAELLAPIHRDARQRVLHRDVLEARQHEIRVRVEARHQRLHARVRAQARRDLLTHQPLQERADQLVRHRLVHVLAPGERAGVAHGAVPDVEQAHLHELVRAHVGHQHGAHALPGGALAVHEVVLDDPVLVRLAHHRPRVVHARRRLERGEVAGGGGGGDAVHHRAREARLLLQPPLRLGAQVQVRGGAQHSALRHLAVVRQVVAGHDRERPQAAPPPRRERGEHDAENRERRVSGAAGDARVALGASASVAPSSAARTSARSPSLMGTRYPNSVMVSETIFVLGEARRPPSPQVLEAQDHVAQRRDVVHVHGHLLGGLAQPAHDRVDEVVGAQVVAHLDVEVEHAHAGGAPRLGALEIHPEELIQVHLRARGGKRARRVGIGAQLGNDASEEFRKAGGSGVGSCGRPKTRARRRGKLRSTYPRRFAAMRARARVAATRAPRAASFA